MMSDDLTFFPKSRRNKLSNKPLMTALAEAVSAHATIVTDRRSNRWLCIAIDDNFYDILVLAINYD
jgi:hypothetical protein